MNRLRFLSLLVIIALLVAACGGGAPAVDAPAAEAPAAEAPAAEAPAADAAAAADGALEAPMLAAKVAAGELAPLEERLPKTPRVVGPETLLVAEHQPDWAPGQYQDGSVLRTAHSVADWAPDVFVMLNEDLVAFFLVYGTTPSTHHFRTTRLQFVCWTPGLAVRETTTDLSPITSSIIPSLSSTTSPSQSSW